MSAFNDKLQTALAEDDDASGGEEVEAELDLSAVSISGGLEISGGKGKGKPVWCVLVAGSLFWYKDSKLKSLKGDMALKDCEILEEGEDIAIQSDGKKILTMSKISQKSDWVIALKAATIQEPGQPPARVAGKGSGAGLRAKKYIAGKAATSSVGKAVAKANINDEAKTLITCVKNLTTAVYDAKTANQVENNIIKLFVKAHILDSNKQLEDDWWLAMDGSLREAFKVGVRICDNIQSGRVIPDDILKEWIGSIQKNLHEAESKLYALLQPYLQPKSLQRIPACFEVFCNESFLRTILVEYDDKLKKDAEELQYTMERYLTISW